jgi:hypothetical protein
MAFLVFHAKQQYNVALVSFVFCLMGEFVGLENAQISLAVSFCHLSF